MEPRETAEWLSESWNWKMLSVRMPEKVPHSAGWTHANDGMGCFIQEGAGCGVGVLTGAKSGIFVLDIDVAKSGEEDGMGIWKKWCDENGDPETVKAKSGSGGLHYYFKCDERTRTWSNSSKIVVLNGKPIPWDVRTDGGYIICPPTTYVDKAGKTKSYVWVNEPGDYDVAPMPDNLYQFLDKHRARRAKSVEATKEDEMKTALDAILAGDGEKTVTTTKKGKEATKTGEGEASFSLHDVRDLVKLLDDKRFVGSRDEWIQVGMVLKCCGRILDKKEECLEMWKDRSKIYLKYSESELDEQWKSFNSDGLTYGSLVHWAEEDNEGGYADFKNNKYLYGQLFNKKDGHIKICIDLIKTDYICTVVGKYGFFWNKVTKVWDECDRITFSERLRCVLRDFVHKKLSWKISKETDEKVKNTLQIIVDVCGDPTYVDKLVNSVMVACFDSTFNDRINRASHLFPISGGKVVDLREGVVKDRRKEDMFSRECKVGLTEKVEAISVVEQFLLDLCCGDPQMTKFLRDYCGYCLTGEMSAKLMAVLHGPESNNGKSTFIDLLSKLLGFLGVSVNKNIFTTNKKALNSSNAHSEHLVPLAQARLAYTSEIPRGAEANEALLKQITGGDQISYRRCGSKEEVMTPQSKLILVANTLPEWDLSDQAFERRIAYIPFNMKFIEGANPDNRCEKELDVNFKENIKKQKYVDALLTILVPHAVEFYKSGLVIPECLKIAKRNYLDDKDYVKLYVEAMLTVVDDPMMLKENLKLSDVFQSYRAWCTNEQIDGQERARYTRRSFKERLKAIKIGELGIYHKQDVLFGYKFTSSAV